MVDRRLKKKLDADEFFVAPGVFDLTSAMLAERAGLDAAHASGFWLTAPNIGIPAAGLATCTDILSRIVRVVEKFSAPVIADADTGFWGLLDVQYTVRGHERAVGK
jgi:2-methylisocitrate lyase-like PEP mutase family enzyme